MNAIEFVAVNDKGGSVFACGECRTVVSSTAMFGEGPGARDQAAQLAEEHCAAQMCEQCKTALREPYSTLCGVCRREKEAAREVLRFESAEKVTWRDYGGEYLYLEGFGRDGYVHRDELDDVLSDSCFDVDLPRYGYACDPHGLGEIEVWDDVITPLLESSEMHEDAGEEITLVADLQKALDAWLAAQTVTSFSPNFKLAVLIDEEVDAVAAKCADDAEEAEDLVDKERQR